MKQAFTLSETLIAIAIIGIVAALTIPNLVMKYQKHVVETRLKKAYTTFSAVINRSIAENGEPKYWSLPNLGSGNSSKNTQFYVEKYILPYLNNAEFCDTGNTAEKCGQYVGCGWASQNYTLADGTMIGICAYRSDYENEDNAQINFSFSKNKDYFRNKFEFTINYETGKLLPAYFDKTKTREDYKKGFHIDNPNYNDGQGYDIACDRKSDAEYNYHGCTALIWLDGFKIKDDYPW